MYRHIIPVNIMDNGNFAGGFLKKRNTVEAVIIAAVMLIIIKTLLFAVSFLVKTIIFVVLGIMPALLALIGVGDESLSEAFMTYIRYKKARDVLMYNLAALAGEDEFEKKKKGGRKREKRRKNRSMHH